MAGAVASLRGLIERLATHVSIGLNERKFETFARERTVDYGSALLLLIIAAALLWWPVDYWLNRDDTRVVATLSYWRIGIIGLSTTTLVLFWKVELFRRFVYPTAAVSAILHATLLAVLVSPVGGVDKPWFHAQYLVPVATLVLLLPLRTRILTVTLVTAGTLAGVTAMFPGNLSAPHAGTAVATLVFSAVGSIAVGHAIYTLSRTNFAQQQELERQQRVLLRHNAELEEEVTRRLADLRELGAHLERSREDERARIARELHDELGQALVAMRCDAEIAHASPSLAESREALTRLARLLEGQIDSIRRIVADLRPAILDDAGLSAAVEQLVERMSARADLKGYVSTRGPIDAIDDGTAIVLYRILQEALTNVVKHARARVVEVTFEAEGGKVRLEVHDDGVGIPRDAQGPREAGFGLLGMGERARAIGGRLSIEPASPGTRVVVLLDRVEVKA